MVNFLNEKWNDTYYNFLVLLDNIWFTEIGFEDHTIGSVFVRIAFVFFMYQVFMKAYR